MERRHHCQSTLDKHRDSLLSLPGVWAVDIGPTFQQGKPGQEIGLIVFVENKRSREQLAPDEVVPPRIDGVRVDVVPCSLTPSDGQNCYPIAASLSRRRHIVQGGVRISNPFGGVGTLACIGTTAEGDLAGLTAAHVAPFESGIGQPAGNRRNDFIGVTVASELTNDMDAAVVALDGNRRFFRGGVTGVEGPSRFRQLHLDADVLTPVLMVGSCSGWRTGLARLSSVSLPVNYPSGQIYMENHIHLFSGVANRPFNTSGDSGALLLSIDGTQVLGLVIAGGRTDEHGWVGLATPIARIAERFDFRISPPH